MENRGGGRRGRLRENNQPPPVFDPQAFIEAIGAAVPIVVQASFVAATTAWTSATVGQGGTSNLQGFGHICHAQKRERLDWDSLPTVSDVGASKSYNCINILYTKIQNKTTTVVVCTVSYTYSPESHLHIQKLYIYIYQSERGTYCDEPLLVC